MVLKVTDERTGDGLMLRPLVEQARRHYRIVKAITDGGYDSHLGFTYLEEQGIEATITVRRYSSTRARGCPARRRVAVKYLRDSRTWKRQVGYGLR
ncbi:transposase [Candidatus Bathyarchaeota archaeon]|nr:transposase [Candidatus Bathyarchaeota archaeon]